MSLADNKRSVFTTIGSYTSLIEQGDAILQTDLFPSINNKDEIVPFILDVLKTVAGTVGIKEAIGGLIGELVDKAEPQLKTALEKQFIQSNADQTFTSTFLNNGITVPVKDIDISGKFKVNPNSSEGGLIYGAVSDTFDSTAYDTILNAGDWTGFNNIQMKYNISTDKIQIKPSGSTTTIGAFFSSYIADTQLLNKKEIISSVMDGFYGTLAKFQKKTEEQTYNELLVEAQLQQVLDGDDSFVISPDKLDGLQTKSRELVKGEVNYDLGCGLMPVSLDFDDFSNLVSSTSGSTDPFFIANQLTKTIDQSTTDEATQDLTNDNKETMQDGFFQKIINIFTVKMLSAVTTAPQVRMLLGMMSSLQNNGEVKLGNATEDLKNFKTCIKCMSKEIMIAIAGFLFPLAVTYLIKLLKPIITKVIREKINQYSDIIVSLTGALAKIKDVAATVTDTIT